jgi:hypothetical protein
VSLDVLGQVVAAHEAFVAHWTRKTLLPRMRPQVALKFVAAREPLPAEQPVAHERSFTGMPPETLQELIQLSRNMFAFSIGVACYW